MSVMLLLLGASLVVGLLFLMAFIWSVRSGQMDDTYSPAHKILFDNFKLPAPVTGKKSEAAPPAQESNL